MQEQVHTIWDEITAFGTRKSKSEYVIHSHLETYQMKKIRDRYI